MFKEKNKTAGTVIAVLSLTFVLLVSGIIFSPSRPELSAAPVKIDPLPKIQSLTQLKELLETETRYYYDYDLLPDMVFSEDASSMAEMERAPAPQMMTSVAGSAADQKNSVDGGGGGGFSSTNVQVAGVDEADVVKTDGTYIYQCTNQEIIITQAVPADKMKIAARVKYDNSVFSPQEMFITDKHLVLIGSKVEGYYP